MCHNWNESASFRRVDFMAMYEWMDANGFYSAFNMNIVTKVEAVEHCKRTKKKNKKKEEEKSTTQHNKNRNETYWLDVAIHTVELRACALFVYTVASKYFQMTHSQDLVHCACNFVCGSASIYIHLLVSLRLNGRAIVLTMHTNTCLYIRHLSQHVNKQTNNGNSKNVLPFFFF